MQTITGVAAGVPFLAVPPITQGAGTQEGAPVILAWHLMDPPRTEAAFAAALPLAGLDAWRIYLGVPLSGSRMPAGGPEELMRLAFADAVMNVHGPVTTQAAVEFGPAFAELGSRLRLGDGPLGVVGGSIGAAIAQLILTEGNIQIGAAVLISPLVQLRATVDAISAGYGVTYEWSEKSLAVARRLDFVARAGEIARRGEPAVLLVVGEDDGIDGFRAPAQRLRETLAAEYADPTRVGLDLVPGMGHALAEEPGIEPAPQTPYAASVDRLAVTWLRDHLVLPEPAR